MMGVSPLSMKLFQSQDTQYLIGNITVIELRGGLVWVYLWDAEWACPGCRISQKS